MIFWHQQGTPSGAKVTSENETSALGRRSQTHMRLLRQPEGKGGEFKLTRSPDRRVVCRLGLKKIFFQLGACVERAEGHQRPFLLELFSRRTQEGRQTSRASASYLVVNYVVLTALRNASVVPPPPRTNHVGIRYCHNGTGTFGRVCRRWCCEERDNYRRGLAFLEQVGAAITG